MKKIKLLVFGILALLLLLNQTNAAPGDLDASFGNAGKLVIPALGNLTEPKVALHPDGNKYIIAATLSNPLGSLMWLVRVNNDGVLDQGFGVRYDHLTFNDAGARFPTRVLDLKVQTSGKILVLTEGRRSDGTFAAVTQFNDNGTIDTAFGRNGRTIINGFVPRFLATKPDGKIVIAGNVRNPTTFDDLAVAQLTANGGFDTTFDGDGKTSVSFSSCDSCGGTAAIGFGDSLRDLKVQPDGKIILAGWVSNAAGTQTNIGIARLNANGGLDTTFDSDGKMASAVPHNRERSFSNSVVIQNDGNLLVLSSFQTASSHFAPVVVKLTKFSSTGALLSSEVRLPTNGSFFKKVERQSDDKLVYVETFASGSTQASDYRTFRLDSDLSIDSRWGTPLTGVIMDFTLPRSASVHDDIVSDIVVDSSDRTLIVGTTIPSLRPAAYTNVSKVAIVRLIP